MNSWPLSRNFVQCILILLALVMTFAVPSAAQDTPNRGKAFLLSLAVPGLGHRYANHGNWDGSASMFLAADAALWLGLVTATIRQDNLQNAYTTLAALRAGAQVEGKDRTFFLNLGSFQSSEEYLEIQLRNRAWDQIRYVEDRSFQWEWQTEDDYNRYRELQDDAETMRRRRPVLAALLVGNRLLSGILAARAAGRGSVQDSPVNFSLGRLPQAHGRPALLVRARF